MNLQERKLSLISGVKKEREYVKKEGNLSKNLEAEYNFIIKDIETSNNEEELLVIEKFFQHWLE